MGAKKPKDNSAVFILHLLRLDMRRLFALMRKEALQIVRDPSTIVIAFVLPVILLVLFATAISLDIRNVPIALVQKESSSMADSLAASFTSTRYFSVTPARHEKEVEEMVVAGKVNGYVIIPGDFSARISRGELEGLIFLVIDASQPNTASFVSQYTKQVVISWAASTLRVSKSPSININPRMWFNPEVESKYFLVPGAIGIVMTMIGTLLTALVIAREWERGTMEALLSTPARTTEIFLGKLIPYFFLGLIACIFSAAATRFIFEVPMRGSWFALIILSASFMLSALAQGILISTLARNQFIASVVAMLTAFLPAFLLSGFLFEIDSMPVIIQYFTKVLAVRYYITCVQTVFLAGDVWPLFFPNIAIMLFIGGVLLLFARLKTSRTLDG